MKLLSIRPIRGRNIYARFPVVRMTVDLEDLTDTPTCDIEGFNENLLRILPGLKKHKCCKGYEGGFCERLEKGTYLAHVIEHIAIELQNRMGYNISFGKARWDSGKSIYSLVFSYENEFAGLKSGKLAFGLAEALCKGSEIPVNEMLDEIRMEADRNSFGPSTQAIIEAAKKSGIPVLPMDNGSLLQVGHGARSRFVQATLTPGTSCISADISCDKELTKKLLRLNHLPVPEGFTCCSEEEAIRAAKELGFPVVIKPSDGNQGKGVSLNIRNESDLIDAFHAAREFDHRIIVEKFVSGKQYRILVVKGEVVAAARRIAAHVVGDGSSTIAALIDLENCNPLRGEGHDRPLSRIHVCEIVKQVLKKQKYTLDSIPPKDKTVWLRENDNISTGGIAEDVTDEIHPEIKSICGKAAEVIGVEVAGIDLTAGDISQAPAISNATIIEINSAPGIRMHHFPAKGIKRDVAAEIVKRVFPNPEKLRIPIVSITGTNGKTTTSRMAAAIFKEAGHVVGMTSTDGVYIDGKLVDKGDNTGPLSAEMVLRNKSVTAAILETARGGMIRKGLAYDMADVGVITNISEDHLGLDGIENLDDLAYAKCLVAEAVKPDGAVVLNASDHFCSFFMSRAGAKVILISTDSENSLLQHHLMKEGEAVFMKNKTICIGRGKEILPVMTCDNIPATLNGLLHHNVENALAAIASAYSTGISVEVIKYALSRFESSDEHSKGRFNRYDVNGVQVVLDYGHNVEGYKAVARAVNKLCRQKVTGVIGVAGDREDNMIQDVGYLSSQSFDKIIIKEDSDLRGRKAGEVARILLEGVDRGGFCSTLSEYIPNEVEALRKAISISKPGDWVVMFFEKFEPARELIRSLGGEAVPAHVKIPEMAVRSEVKHQAG